MARATTHILKANHSLQVHLVLYLKMMRNLCLKLGEPVEHRDSQKALVAKGLELLRRVHPTVLLMGMLLRPSTFHPDSLEANFYIDYRDSQKYWTIMPFSVRDPTKIDLISTAKRFASRHPSAPFTLIRVWTHSHFYPCTLGWEKRDMLTFADCIGRC